MSGGVILTYSFGFFCKVFTIESSFFLSTTKYIIRICIVRYCNDRTTVQPDHGGNPAAGPHGNERWHMSRGRPPSNGIREALPIARARGRVLEIVQNGDTPAMFVIAVDNKVIFVMIRRADPFRMTPAEIEIENRTVLAMIRSLPGSADIVREFWVYSRAGSLRFFRVEDSWLLEIGRDGLPLSVKDSKPKVEKVGQDKSGE